MGEEQIEEESIIQDFIIEAEDHLGDIEQKAVELEKKGEDIEIINSIFRSFHTIKGNAKWLGFDPIVKVAHAAESLMGDLRNKKIELSSPLIDIILKVKDTVQQFITQLKSKNDLNNVDTAEIISLIEKGRKNG